MEGLWCSADSLQQTGEGGTQGAGRCPGRKPDLEGVLVAFLLTVTEQTLDKSSLWEEVAILAHSLKVLQSRKVWRQEHEAAGHLASESRRGKYSPSCFPSWDSPPPPRSDTAYI